MQEKRGGVEGSRSRRGSQSQAPATHTLRDKWGEGGGIGREVASLGAVDVELLRHAPCEAKGRGEGMEESEHLRAVKVELLRDKTMQDKRGKGYWKGASTSGQSKSSSCERTHARKIEGIGKERAPWGSRSRARAASPGPPPQAGTRRRAAPPPRGGPGPSTRGPAPLPHRPVPPPANPLSHVSHGPRPGPA
jgi:hypothetical protein